MAQGLLFLLVQLQQLQGLFFHQRFLAFQQGLLLQGMLQFLAGAAVDVGEPRLDHLQVGEEQLGVDDGDVPHWVDAVFSVQYVGVFEGPHDMAQQVCFPYGGEELVAAALALGGAPHQAGDVDHLYLGVGGLLGLEQT